MRTVKFADRSAHHRVGQILKINPDNSLIVRCGPHEVVISRAQICKDADGRT